MHSQLGRIQLFVRFELASELDWFLQGLVGWIHIDVGCCVLPVHDLHCSNRIRNLNSRIADCDHLDDVWNVHFLVPHGKDWHVQGALQ